MGRGDSGEDGKGVSKELRGRRGERLENWKNGRGEVGGLAL